MIASSCSGSRWFKYYKQQIKEKCGITPAFLFELLLNKGRLCRKGEAMNIRKDIDYSAMFIVAAFCTAFLNLNGYFEDSTPA